MRTLARLGLALGALVLLTAESCPPVERLTGPTPTPSPNQAVKAGLSVFAACEQAFSPLLDSFEELDARLEVGLTYNDYLATVQRLGNEYRQVDRGPLQAHCLREIDEPLSDALLLYIEAHNVWRRCIYDQGCSLESVEPTMQDKWENAADLLEEAREGLRTYRGGS